jgi:hypothetical protein
MCAALRARVACCCALVRGAAAGPLSARAAAHATQWRSRNAPFHSPLEALRALVCVSRTQRVAGGAPHPAPFVLVGVAQALLSHEVMHRGVLHGRVSVGWGAGPSTLLCCVLHRQGGGPPALGAPPPHTQCFQQHTAPIPHRGMHPVSFPPCNEIGAHTQPALCVCLWCAVLWARIGDGMHPPTPPASCWPGARCLVPGWLFAAPASRHLCRRRSLQGCARTSS